MLAKAQRWASGRRCPTAERRWVARGARCPGSSPGRCSETAVGRCRPAPDRAATNVSVSVPRRWLTAYWTTSGDTVPPAPFASPSWRSTIGDPRGMPLTFLRPRRRVVAPSRPVNGSGFSARAAVIVASTPWSASVEQMAAARKTCSACCGLLEGEDLATDRRGRATVAFGQLGRPDELGGGQACLEDERRPVRTRHRPGLRGLPADAREHRVGLALGAGPERVADHLTGQATHGMRPRPALR